MIVFSDLHLRESSEGACAKVLAAVGELARQQTQPWIVFCGDFWHIRYQVSVRLQNMVAAWLESLGKFRVDFVVGNHDQIDTVGANALEVFRAFGNVRVWTEPGVADGYGFVPYRKDPAAVTKMLSAVATQRPRRIFAHFGVSGSLMNNGTADQSGFYVPQNLPPLILGHYHKRQEGPPGAGGEPIWRYVGSPYQTSFGEAGNVCSVLDVSDALVQVAPLDLGLPVHHIIEWDPAVSVDPPPVPGRPGDRVRLDIKASQEMIIAGKFGQVLKKHGLGEAQVNVVPVAVSRDHKFAVQAGESVKDAAVRFAKERLPASEAERPDLDWVISALGRWQS